MNKLLQVISLLIGYFAINSAYAQFTIPAKPTKVTEQVAVYDYANILSLSLIHI